jgi:hypothetical protein
MKDILWRIFGPDPDELNAYRNVIPNSIQFSNVKEGDDFIIKITQIDDDILDDSTLLITQAKTKDQIVPAVNDLVMTYFDIPLSLRRYYEKNLVLQGQLNKNATLVKA